MYHIVNMTEKVVSFLDMYIATYCLAESEYMRPSAGYAYKCKLMVDSCSAIRVQCMYVCMS